MTRLARHQPPLKPGDRAPDFSLPAADREGTVSLADYRGRTPLLPSGRKPRGARGDAALRETLSEMEAIMQNASLGIVFTRDRRRVRGPGAHRGAVALVGQAVPGMGLSRSQIWHKPVELLRLSNPRARLGVARKNVSVERSCR